MLSADLAGCCRSHAAGGAICTYVPAYVLHPELICPERLGDDAFWQLQLVSDAAVVQVREVVNVKSWKS